MQTAPARRSSAVARRLSSLAAEDLAGARCTRCTRRQLARCATDNDARRKFSRAFASLKPLLAYSLDWRAAARERRRRRCRAAAKGSRPAAAATAAAAIVAVAGTLARASARAYTSCIACGSLTRSRTLIQPQLALAGPLSRILCRRRLARSSDAAFLVTRLDAAAASSPLYARATACSPQTVFLLPPPSDLELKLEHVDCKRASARLQLTRAPNCSIDARLQFAQFLFQLASRASGTPLSSKYRL